MRRAPVLVVSAILLASVPAPAAAAVGGSSEPPVAVAGKDSALWALGTSGWQSLGGVLLADPAVAVIPPSGTGQSSALVYIGTGADHDIWVRDDTHGWQTFSPLAGYCVGAPTAVVASTAGLTTITVGCKGADGALWTTIGNISGTNLPTGSGTWTSLGGQFEGEPAGVQVQGTTQYVGIGLDGHLWIRTANTAWSQMETQCFGHPAAASVTGFAVIACHGLDRAVSYLTNTGSSWVAQLSAGGIVQEVLAVRPRANDMAIDAMGADDQVWEIGVSQSGGLGGWSQVGGLVNATPEDPFTNAIPVYAQTMPLDCETAVLQMALSYLGHYYNQGDLFPLEHADTRPAMNQNGTLHWGDPFTNFVGDVNGKQANYTGYGVYYPVILGIANNQGDPAARGGQNMSALQLYQDVASGRPVQVWVEHRWARPPLGSWIAWDGRTITYSQQEHSVVLSGVSDTAVRVNDPGNGSQYWVSRGTFETSFADFGNMAIVY